MGLSMVRTKCSATSDLLFAIFGCWEKNLASSAPARERERGRGCGSRSGEGGGGVASLGASVGEGMNALTLAKGFTSQACVPARVRNLMRCVVFGVGVHIERLVASRVRE